MANPHKGEVEVILNGRPFMMRLDFNALAELEEVLGQSVQAAFAEGQVGLRTLRAALYAGIKEGYGPRRPKLSVSLVGRWMQRGPVGLEGAELLAYYGDKVGEAIKHAFGDLDAAAEEEDGEDSFFEPTDE